MNQLIFEHQFWLQILGDHSRFIFYSLAATEDESLHMASQFINSYDQMLVMAHQPLSQVELDDLTKEALEKTHQLKDFKLKLLESTLVSDLKIHLPPTFFNHMINELEEYLLVVTNAVKGKDTLFHPIHYHLKWLSDAAGHAGSVADNLDPIEKDMKNTNKLYENVFQDLFMKSIEINGYTRTEMTQFPSLERLNSQVEEVMYPFMELLEDIRDLRLSHKLLGTLMPLMADHMAREECYYLNKLSQVSNTKSPECDPTRPRIE